MKRFETTLKEEILELRHVIEEARRRLADVPTGTLRVRNWNGKVEYYYRNTDTKNAKESRRNGRYLKKSEEDLAKAIVQRDYDTTVIKKAGTRIKAIEKFLELYQKTSLKQLYQETNPFRRNLLETEIISDEEFIKQWQSVGLYLGVNLFITHETSRSPLNTRALDGMLRKAFCEE